MKCITYLYYSPKHEQFAFVNFSRHCSVLKSSHYESEFHGTNHWFLEQAILIDYFEEKV